MKQLANILRLQDRVARRVALAVGGLLPVGLLLASVIGSLDPLAGIGAGIATIVFLLGAIVSALSDQEQHDRQTTDRLTIAIDEISRRVAALDRISEQVVELTARAGPDGVTVRQQIGDHPWDAMFTTATDVMIIARYFTEAVKGAGPDAVMDFFKRGGTVRVVTVDPRSPAARNSLTAAFRPDHRVQRSPRLLIRVEDSIVLLDELRRAAGAREDQVAIYPFGGCLHWAGYAFDDEILVFAPYAQFSDGMTRGPRFEIDLKRNPSVSKFWTTQCDGMTQSMLTDAGNQDPLVAGEYLALFGPHLGLNDDDHMEVAT